MSATMPSTVPRRWPRFSLAQLLLATSACALALSALAVASSVWWRFATTSMVGLFAVAVMAASLLRPGAWRGFWLGYAAMSGLFALPVLFEWENVRYQLLPFELSRLAGQLTTVPPKPATPATEDAIVVGGLEFPVVYSPTPDPDEQAREMFRLASVHHRNQVYVLHAFAVIMMGLCGGVVGAWLAVPAQRDTK